MFFSFFRRKRDDDDEDDDFYGRPDPAEESRGGAKEAPLPPPIGSGVGRLDRQRRLGTTSSPASSGSAASSA
ncbi:MAG: hypothetical protein ACI4NA_04760, partial [Succinivibrio sp.]